MCCGWVGLKGALIPIAQSFNMQAMIGADTKVMTGCHTAYQKS